MTNEDDTPLLITPTPSPRTDTLFMSVTEKVNGLPVSTTYKFKNPQ